VEEDEEDARNFFPKKFPLTRGERTTHTLYVMYKIYMYPIASAVHATRVRAYTISLYTLYYIHHQDGAPREEDKNPNFITPATAMEAGYSFLFFLMFGTRENKSFRIPEKCPFNRGPDE